MLNFVTKRADMKRICLTNEEKEIEKALVAGEYVNVHPKTFEEIATTIIGRKKESA